RTASKTTGVVAVSMSWSGSEPGPLGDQGGADSGTFVTPAGHVGGSGLTGGVTFLAATGDWGAYDHSGTTFSPQYPATSPNVVAVGGTKLTINGTSYGGEVAWGYGTSSGSSGGGGGGISNYETQPAYQSGL